MALPPQCHDVDARAQLPHGGGPGCPGRPLLLAGRPRRDSAAEQGTNFWQLLRSNPCSAATRSWRVTRRAR